MNPLPGVAPSFEISVMQFSKTTFIKLFVTLGYAFVGYSHRFGRRTCHTVGELVQNQPYMDGQPPAVFIIRPVDVYKRQVRSGACRRPYTCG